MDAAEIRPRTSPGGGYGHISLSLFLSERLKHFLRDQFFLHLDYLETLRVKRIFDNIWQMRESISIFGFVAFFNTPLRVFRYAHLEREKKMNIFI